MKKGFTLAEVLITLGIIGVVSAMTIPALQTKINRSKVETIFKEDYSIIQQVLKMAEAQDASIETIPNSNVEALKTWFKRYMEPNMKTVSVCYNTAGCWANTGTKTLQGNNVNFDRKNVGIGNDIITIRLTNGSNLNFDVYNSGEYKQIFGIETTNLDTFVIFIDTNGDNPPNVVGKDIYVLVWKEGSLLPAGNDVSTDEVNKNCSMTATGQNAGYYCTKRLMNNNWKIPKDIVF